MALRRRRGREPAEVVTTLSDIMSVTSCGPVLVL